MYLFIPFCMFLFQLWFFLAHVFGVICESFFLFLQNVLFVLQHWDLMIFSVIFFLYFLTFPSVLSQNLFYHLFLLLNFFLGCLDFPGELFSGYIFQIFASLLQHHQLLFTDLYCLIAIENLLLMDFGHHGNRVISRPRWLPHFGRLACVEILPFRGSHRRFIQVSS